MPARHFHAVLAAILLMLASPALAKEKSSVAYYPVTGSNAVAVYDSIKKTSPKIARNATFAFTMIATKTDKKTAEGKEGCRYTSFATSAAYIFNLPQHVKSASLPKSTLSKWKSFVAYLHTHEEGHRRSRSAETRRAVAKVKSPLEKVARAK